MQTLSIRPFFVNSVAWAIHKNRASFLQIALKIFRKSGSGVRINWVCYTQKIIRQLDMEHVNRLIAPVTTTVPAKTDMPARSNSSIVFSSHIY